MAAMGAKCAFQSHSVHRQPCGTKGRDIGLKSCPIGAKLGLCPGGDGEIPADGQKLRRCLLRLLRLINLLIDDQWISYEPITQALNNLL